MSLTIYKNTNFIINLSSPHIPRFFQHLYITINIVMIAIP